MRQSLLAARAASVMAFPWASSCYLVEWFLDGVDAALRGIQLIGIGFDDGTAELLQGLARWTGRVAAYGDGGLL